MKNSVKVKLALISPLIIYIGYWTIMAWITYGSIFLGEDNVYPSLSLMMGAGIAYTI